MGHRESILSPQGYEVRYEQLPKERDSAPTKHCIATKGGEEYFASRVCLAECPHDRPEHYQHVEKLQESIPRMARMVVIEDVVLLERAHGKKLWEIEAAPDHAETVERQLIEFALGTKACQLIHGDLRPWNVFFDPYHGVQVIDWLCLSSFVDDLSGEQPRRRDLVEGHYLKFHPDLVAQNNYTEIDLEDARVMGKLLKGQIGQLTEAWTLADRRSYYPPWCVH